MKVSIIIPVHNSAQYLPKCVTSCLGQTLQDIEIILVDDASTDNSKDLIAAYAAQYPQKVIPIYLEENLRQGGARNRGIEAAKGEYLCFVDSDDWIEPDMCEQLYEAAKAQDADMAGGNCYISSDTEDIPQNLGYVTAVLGKENIYNLNCYFRGQGYFWNRIYRRKMLLEHKIFFPEHTFYEDAYFNFLTGLYANRVVKVEKNLYHYYQSPNSTIRVRNQPRAYDRIGVAKLLIESCKSRGIYQDFHEIIDSKFISMSASNILYNCLGSFDEPSVEKLSEIRTDIQNFCPQFRDNQSYKAMSADMKCYLNICMVSPRLAVWCYKHSIHTVFVYGEIIKRKLHVR